MKCPTCETIDLSISERKNVEIDFCPKCRGVWLDKGELDKIIELSIKENTHHTSDEKYKYENKKDEDKKYGEKEYYKKHKKESFLSELFDF